MDTDPRTSRHKLVFGGHKLLNFDMKWNSNAENNNNLQVFLVFKYTKIPSSREYKDGIIGHDNGGYDRFIAVRSNILIFSGTRNDVITIKSDEEEFTSLQINQRKAACKFYE